MSEEQKRKEHLFQVALMLQEAAFQLYYLTEKEEHQILWLKICDISDKIEKLKEE